MSNDHVTIVENKSVTPTVASIMIAWSDFATEHDRIPTMEELEALTTVVLKDRLNQSTTKEIAFWALHAALMIYGDYAPRHYQPKPGDAFRKS